jgi:hypothetical protein
VELLVVLADVELSPEGVDEELPPLLALCQLKKVMLKTD